MANNNDGQIVLGLDIPKTVNQINSDIKKLQNQLEQVKATGALDTNTTVKQINAQIASLQSQLKNIELKANINTGNITNQSQQVGQQIGKQVQNGINSVIQKGNFEKIFRASGNGINNVSKDAEKYFKTLSNTVSVQERLGNNNNLTSFTVSLKNAEGVAEQLNYQLRKITDDKGNIIDRYFEYSGGSINDNGVIQQMNTISAKADSLQTKLEKLKSSYSDMNASRPIKDSNNISALSQQYDKVAKSIENVRNADSASFSSMVSNAQREITVLENMVSQFRNAENVATQMKSVDISSGIAQAQERLGKLKANASGFDQMKQTIVDLDTAIANVGDKSSLDAFINKLKVAESQLGRVKAETKQLHDVNKIQLSSEVTKLTTDYQKFGVVSQEVENNLKELKLAQEAVVNAKGTDRLATEIDKNNTKLAETKSSLKELTTTQVSMNQRTSQLTSMQEWMRKNKAATKLVGNEVNKLIEECKTCDAVRFNGIKNEFKELQVQAGKAGKLGNSLFGGLIEQGKKFVQWIGVTGAVMEGVQAFRKATSNVIELDTKMVELSKVSDLTAQGLEDVTNQCYDLGESLSKTGTDVLDAVTTFKRAGYDIADSMEYAEEALKTANISENLKDASQNASSLVNIMKGFQNESPEFAKKINDAVNQVSNTEAVNFDNLIDGATRLSAVADQAGLSFEQMLGTLTGGYEILGNMEKVATGQITIFSRLQAIQLDGEEEVSTVAKLQEKFSNATKGAVNIVDQTSGQLRNVYDILDDLAGVWDTLDKNTREALAIEAAGIRQKQVFLALMQNWKGVEDAVESAKNSLGSADEENEKYINSIQGKLENLESATQKLSKTLIDSDLVKFFVDLGTTGVKAIDGLVNALTPLGTAAGIGGIVAGFKNIGRPKMFGLYKYADINMCSLGY